MNYKQKSLFIILTVLVGQKKENFIFRYFSEHLAFEFRSIINLKEFIKFFANNITSKQIKIVFIFILKSRFTIVVFTH
jgi:hypothetical protein